MSKPQDFLLGADMSRYQYGQWQPSYLSFLILKATEGRTYEDGCMERFMSDLAIAVPDAPPFLGFYHYARAENNTPSVEAENFLSKIEPHIGNCFMVLDVEGESFQNNNIDMWALQWCMDVAYNANALPIIYCSASCVQKFPETLKRYPLWVAHYNVTQPKIKNSKVKPIMWQYTSKPFDTDIFYGSPADMVDLISRPEEFARKRGLQHG